MATREVLAGKLPPQNIDAEKSLLGAVLIDEETLADISEHVTPKDFYDKRHAIIYAGMMRLYEKHRPVDLLTLTEELKRKNEIEIIGGSAYLTELTNYVPTAAHAEAYAELVALKLSVVASSRPAVRFLNLAITKRRPLKNSLRKPKPSYFQSAISRSNKTSSVSKAF